MKYLVAVLVTVMTAVLSYVSLNKKVTDKIKVFAVADKEENYVSKDLSLSMILVGVGVLAAIVFLSTLKIIAKVYNPIGIIKMILALVCMVGAACFDYREHRIPNAFPLTMLVGAVVLLLFGILLKQAGALDYVTTSVVAAVGCAAILTLASVLTKQGIGAGDIKLISTLALLTGVYSVMGTLFFGIVACSVYAVTVLLMKKKKASSGVPFGPFLLLGYIITLFTITF